ncbi:hypothetical protein A2Z00_00020 [Candidatus Gottesmanbacteria bacterium RBG_13_45_10]|uniref:Non-canonical purine NTP pyrophosphatase n=1 Tax=Candidatus Gottesmanbacteria bacterium RBG_13_45_10 TaxID=1798370 RepID=A0A1F5ZHS9_9BACT|nr:MAG: hypothetical protein A2Z00_00020 [Candidatus Gottesmanbacteria bacterium RBG_13_45_10]
MKKLLIATTNPGKLNEIKHFLFDVPVTFVGLDDVGITERARETGETFEENAILKAKFYGKLSKLPTLADDGGFEIEALGGDPGVKSHRWIHGESDDDDEELIDYTLMRMKDLPENQRKAQLRLVIALYVPGGKVVTAEEKIIGIVPTKPSSHRTAGFPFRSLLFLPHINKFYNDHELTQKENEVYNHRRKALEKLKPFIIKELC